MSQSTAHTITTGQIVADNGKAYPDSVYHEKNRATGTQQEVADMWADGALPTHSTSGNRVMLYTSTKNFCGYQYPDGRGLLKHYSHIQAVRTRSGLVIGDSSCWAKGFAHCSYPKDKDGMIDLTTLKENLKHDDEGIYDIVSINRPLIEFESGRKYNLDKGEWSDPTPNPIDSNVLGL